MNLPKGFARTFISVELEKDWRRAADPKDGEIVKIYMDKLAKSDFSYVQSIS